MVRPFTTIQFLENFIFSEKSTSSYEGWSDSCNMRFADNKRIRYRTTLDGNIIPSELTVYEAVCCFGIDGNEEDVFSKQFKFTFSRVEVDISPEKGEFWRKSMSSSIFEDMIMLRILHRQCSFTLYFFASPTIH